MFFALILIICISGANLFKSLLAGMLGMAVSFVGNAPVDSIPRFTFKTNALVDGFALLPMVIGLFAVTTIMGNAARPMGTDEGLILIDCMYREVLYLLIDSIRALGFDPHNIKHLLLTHGHFDHCGAARELQEMSNCQVWVGRDDAFFFTERRDLIAFEDHVAPFRIDHYYDYDKPIEFGGMKIYPVPCPGHTPGTTCLFFDVEHAGETLTLGIHGGLGTNGLSTLELTENRLPLHLQSDYLEHLLLLKDRKVDVLIPSHAGHAVDYSFFDIASRDDGTGNGFIDRGAWKRMLESRIAMIQSLIAQEKAEQQNA